MDMAFVGMGRPDPYPTRPFCQVDQKNFLGVKSGRVLTNLPISGNQTIRLVPMNFNVESDPNLIGFRWSVSVTIRDHRRNHLVIVRRQGSSSQSSRPRHLVVVKDCHLSRGEVEEQTGGGDMKGVDSGWSSSGVNESGYSSSSSLTRP